MTTTRTCEDCSHSVWNREQEGRYCNHDDVVTISVVVVGRRITELCSPKKPPCGPGHPKFEDKSL